MSALGRKRTLAADASPVPPNVPYRPEANVAVCRSKAERRSIFVLASLVPLPVRPPHREHNHYRDSADGSAGQYERCVPLKSRKRAYCSSDQKRSCRATPRHYQRPTQGEHAHGKQGSEECERRNIAIPEPMQRVGQREERHYKLCGYQARQQDACGTG